MDSETHDIVPVNNKCQGHAETKIISNPGTDTNQAAKDIQSGNNQNKADAQYDAVDDMKVKPMYGGKNNNILFKISFMNKKWDIYDINEKNAIKQILNNKIYKKDYILEISYHSIKSVYIIKANYKNKFKKIY